MKSICDVQWDRRHTLSVRNPCSCAECFPPTCLPEGHWLCNVCVLSRSSSYTVTYCHHYVCRQALLSAAGPAGLVCSWAVRWPGLGTVRPCCHPCVLLLPSPGPHPLPPPQLPIVPSAKKLIYSLHYPTHRSNVRNNVTSSYWELFVYQAVVLWLCSVQREIRKLATNPQSHRPENVLLFVLSFSSMYLPFCFNRIEMRP